MTPEPISAVGAKGQASFLQGLVTATAVGLAALTAANVMEGSDGVIAAFPPCLSFLLGVIPTNRYVPIGGKRSLKNDPCQMHETP
jgi:hypothetical protein